MSYLPQPQRRQRPTRVRPAEYTRAVLRIEDGSCTQATLEILSLTGGLLSLPKPLDRGSRARLMFLTQTGSVLGVAEMLKPVSWTEQPFRFVVLHEDDQRRLQAATQPVVEPGTVVESATVRTKAPVLPPKKALVPNAEEQWIEKYRTAIYDSPLPPKRFPRMFFAALAAAALSLGAIVYAFQAHLLR